MVDGVTYLPLCGVAPPVDRPQMPRPGADRFSSGLRLRSFIVDEPNVLALAAVEAMLGELASPPPLVVLHGPSGVGKSHLAAALARTWQSSHADARVVAVTGADFARRWGRSAEDEDDNDTSDDDDATGGAVTGDDATKHRRVAWSGVRLFVLDNVDDLAGKPAAQSALCEALDAIVAGGGRAIVTARRKPSRDQRLTRRLASRLAGGLNVPLAKLGKAGRIAVLAELALARGLSLSPAELTLLAGASPASVSELAGLLTRLDLAARSEGHALDESRIREHLAACGKTGPTARTVTLRTAEHFGVKASDLRSPSRRKEIVTARSVAMYLIRDLLGESLQAIGRHFSGRDHATVSHNVEKVARQLAEGDAEICQAVTRIRERLAEAG